MCVYVGAGAYGSQKRASGPLELGLEVLPNMGSGNQPWSSVRAKIHAFNYGVLSPTNTKYTSHKVNATLDKLSSMW